MEIYVLKVDKSRIKVWVNMLADVNSYMKRREYFNAGYLLCLVQTSMAEAHDELQRKEEESNRENSEK